MKILGGSVVVLLLIGSALNLGFAQDWLPRTPSFLLKLFPKPKFEKYTLEGSGENGRIIDLQGGWLNEGNLTEMLICSKNMEKGWDVPERITIRNGSIRGSIRIYGLGVNGEAAKVRESSRREGHTARAQAAAPRAILLEEL